MSARIFEADGQTIDICAGYIMRFEGEGWVTPSSTYTRNEGEEDDGPRRIREAKFHLKALGTYDEFTGRPKLAMYMPIYKEINQQLLCDYFADYYIGERVILDVTKALDFTKPDPGPLEAIH